MNAVTIQAVIGILTFFVVIGRAIYGARKKDIEAVTEQLRILNGRVRATEIGLATEVATVAATAAAAAAAASTAAAALAATKARRDT